MNTLRDFIRKTITEAYSGPPRNIHDFIRSGQERDEKRKEFYKNAADQVQRDEKSREDSIRQQEELKSRQEENEIQHINNNIPALVEELTGMAKDGRLEKFPRNDNEYFVGYREMPEIIAKYGMDENVFYSEVSRNHFENYGLTWVEYLDTFGYVLTVNE